MEGVVIVIESGHRLEIEEALAGLGGVGVTLQGDGHPTVIFDGSSHIYVNRVDDAVGDFEPDDLAAVYRVVADPDFYSLEFSNIDFCRAVMLRLVDRSDLYVHNDHGVFLRGDAFAQALRDRPTWDWRRDRVGEGGPWIWNLDAGER